MIEKLSGPRIVMSEIRLTLPQTMEFAKTNALPSNKDVSLLLRSGDLRGDFRTGTLVVAETPGTGFKATVRFNGVSVSIPEGFQGLEDVLLVCEYPDYTFQNGVLTMEKNIIMVENYPKVYGWYLPHKVTMIPQGERVRPSDPDALCLYRAEGAYVGLVVRGVFDDGRLVGLGYWTGYALWVAQYIGESNGVPAVPQNGLMINGVTAAQFSAAKDAFQNHASTLHPDLAEPLAVLFRGKVQ